MRAEPVQARLLGRMAASEQLRRRPGRPSRRPAAPRRRAGGRRSCTRTAAGSSATRRAERRRSGGSPSGSPSGRGRGLRAPTRSAADLPGGRGLRRTGPAACWRSRSRSCIASYVLWFRPEVVRTVKWGGDPRKPTSRAGGRPACTRRELLRELEGDACGGRSLPWRPSEVEAAPELRHAIVGIVLRRAEELAELAEELQRAQQGAGGVLLLGLARPARAVPAHRRLRRAAAARTRAAGSPSKRPALPRHHHRAGPSRPARWSTTC